MSWDSVAKYLKQFDADGRMISFDVSSATVELAAEALHVSPARIAKTISLKHGEHCVLIVMSGDAKIDKGKFKRQFGVQASMLPLERVEEETGHPVGGVCPFAVRENVPVYLDVSLKRFQTVFPAAGTANSAIELSIEELERFSAARGWVDIGKSWDPDQRD